MSVLQTCYRLSSSAKKTVRPTETSYHELRLLIALAPLLHSSFRRKTADVMLCSDASMLAGASLYHTQENFHACQSVIVGKLHKFATRDAPPPQNGWRQIAAYKWKFKKHINVLEGQAVLVGLRWFARQRRFMGTRVSVLTDSQVLFYMLGRGRSGADRLWRLSRSIAALLLAGNIRVIPVWVPSKDNPADEPSRNV